MAHEVETMMYAREVPWHGIGFQVEKEVTADAAIRFSELDWECEKKPIYLAGFETPEMTRIGQQVPNRQAVVRKTDKKILGVVSDAYEIIQNANCFDFMDSLIGEGLAAYHTAGALFGGRVLFMTVKLPESSQIGPDKIDKYLLLSSSHDGSQALSIRWTPVRVVCANTLEFAQRGKCSQTVNIRHRRNYRTKIEEARSVLELTEHYYKQMEVSFQRLLDTPFSESQMSGFAGLLFPTDENGKVSKQSKDKRAKLSELFVSGVGQSNVARTQWAAYNAVTEYVDHHASYRAREGVDSDENKMNSVFFGGGHELKKKAFDLLTADC